MSPFDPEHVGPEGPVYAYLNALGIAYERHEHPPTFTVEDAGAHWAEIDAAHCKNLFLRNQRDDRHYLLIVSAQTRVDLRAVAAQIGDGKLSFASPDRLMWHLGVTPGSVSPFGLITDQDRHVRVFVDRDLQACTRISFHPNINTRTLVLDFQDFARFLASTGHGVHYINVRGEGTNTAS